MISEWICEESVMRREEKKWRMGAVSGAYMDVNREGRVKTKGGVVPTNEWMNECAVSRRGSVRELDRYSYSVLILLQQTHTEERERPTTISPHLDVVSSFSFTLSLSLSLTALSVSSTASSCDCHYHHHQIRKPMHSHTPSSIIPPPTFFIPLLNLYHYLIQIS